MPYKRCVHVTSAHVDHLRIMPSNRSVDTYVQETCERVLLKTEYYYDTNSILADYATIHRIDPSITTMSYQYVVYVHFNGNLDTEQVDTDMLKHQFVVRDRENKPGLTVDIELSSSYVRLYVAAPQTTTWSHIDFIPFPDILKGKHQEKIYGFQRMKLYDISLPASNE